MGTEDQIVGAMMYNTASDPPVGDPEYDSIYRAVEDNGLQIAYHGGTSALQYGMPRLDQSQRTWFESGFCAHAFTRMLTTMSLISNGVPEKFPGLNFVLLEAGVSWLPYAMFRLNTFYHARRSEVPLLEKAPEAYIRDQVFLTTQPLGQSRNPDHLKHVMDVVGPESILFATDYPHQDFDHPNVFQTYSLDFSPDELGRMLGGNAVELFGL